MTGAMRGYVFVVDLVNRRVGRFIMYGLFAIMAILLWSSLSKTFFNPSLWTLEMAQFAMVAYYILGGPYAVQTDANVRMDLFYGSWSARRKAWFDVFTVFFSCSISRFFYGAESTPRFTAFSTAANVAPAPGGLIFGRSRSSWSSELS